MLIPLFVLAVGAILAGLPFYQIFVGPGVEGFFRDSLKLRHRAARGDAPYRVWIASLPTVAMALGFAVA